MDSLYWYQLSPGRLVLEWKRVKSLGRDFVLKRVLTSLYWECETFDVPGGVAAPPLKYLVLYPDAFPALPPHVEIQSPSISLEELGHDWHRWYNGNICYVRPSKWLVSTTADEVIMKIEDWYFNYTAKKAGLIDKMPDVGRAQVFSEDPSAERESQ